MKSEESLNRGSLVDVSTNSNKIDQSTEHEAQSVEIKVESIEESKMELATEVIRESSPRSQERPKLVRQNSAEMQQAVEVQRPVSSQRKISTCLTRLRSKIDVSCLFCALCALCRPHVAKRINMRHVGW